MCSRTGASGCRVGLRVRRTAQGRFDIDKYFSGTRGTVKKLIKKKEGEHLMMKVQWTDPPRHRQDLCGLSSFVINDH